MNLRAASEQITSIDYSHGKLLLLIPQLDIVDCGLPNTVTTILSLYFLFVDLRMASRSITSSKSSSIYVASSDEEHGTIGTQSYSKRKSENTLQQSGVQKRVKSEPELSASAQKVVVEVKILW